MHEDQIDVTAETVSALVADQFPQWRARPVRAVNSDGTVNALFRLGEEVVLRFPLRPGQRDELLAEQENARLLAPHVPVAVPEPLGMGEPGRGYPGPWAAYRWLPGAPVTSDNVTDQDGFARELAGFARALHSIGTGGRKWPGRGRGGPLAGDDDWVQHSLSRSARLIDTLRLGRIWARCRDIPRTGEPDVRIHADLMPGNLLVREGQLSAVIDLGTVTIGDPAVDVMPAWNLLGPTARAAYKAGLEVSDATWERGRGWTILQAIGSLWYYVETNPAMAATARRTLEALLDDE